MIEELNRCFIGSSVVCNNKSGETETDDLTTVEVVDANGDTVEIGYNTHGGKKRSYLKFNHKAMAKAIKASRKES
jgi:hypothetical protein